MYVLFRKILWNLSSNAVHWIVGIILFTLLIIFTVFLFQEEGYLTYDKVWSHILDPLIAVGTVGAALIIAVQNYVQQYLSALPKRLNMNYVCDGRYIAGCKEAYLSGVGDIRQWTLNTGRELLEGQLSFYPYLKQEGPKDILDEAHPRRVYTCTMYLRDIPTPSSPSNGKFQLLNSLHSNYGYVLWVDNESNTPANREIILECKKGHIVDPLTPFEGLNSDDYAICADSKYQRILITPKVGSEISIGIKKAYLKVDNIEHDRDDETWNLLRKL